jgi:hypothetical protein
LRLLFGFSEARGCLEEGIEGLASFGHEGSARRLSDAQQDKLKAWITATLPGTTREVGDWIETECGITV